MSRRSKLGWLMCVLALTACGEENEEGTSDAGVQDGGTPTNDAALPALSDATVTQQDAAMAPQDAGPQDASLPTVTRPFQGSGVSGNVAGSVVTYGNVMVYPNNTGDGRITLEGVSSTYIAKWRIQVPGTPGTYACDDEGKVTVVQLINASAQSSVGSGAGSCSVTLVRAGNGVIEGTFVASLLDSNMALKDVTAGHFFYDQYGGGAGGDGLAANEGGASFLVDGVRHTYQGAAPNVLETYAGLVARPTAQNSPGAPLGIQLHSIPNAVGTYRCGEGEPYRAVNVWFWWKGAFLRGGARQMQDGKGPMGNSCTIEVTKVGTINGYNYAGTFEGTFSGTFVKDDASSSVTVTGGTFRLVGTP